MHPTVAKLATILAAISCLAGVSRAQTPGDARTFPWEGEVTGTNVYVRSGAGSNWYPTSKLDVGARVLVLEEKFGWYKIVPPTGSFSYVDASMVQRSADGTTGVLTADRVYVRAGSALNARKSASQRVLSKGATVKIIGEADGFYKIAPPQGAALYISKQYVKPVEPRVSTGLLETYRSGGARPARRGEARSARERNALPMTETPLRIAAGLPDNDDAREPIVPAPIVRTPPKTPIARAGGANMPARLDTGGTVTETAAESPSPRPAPVAAPSPKLPTPEAGRYKAMLAVLESDLESELRKPLREQRIGEFRPRYEEIAGQDDEYVPGAIAKIRVRQLRDRLRLRDARVALAAEHRDLEQYRSGLRRERDQIARDRAAASAVETFDLEGELRISYAFPPEMRRFRLVDPVKGSTLAYVDVPRDVEANPRHLIGRYVGIHASRQAYSASARTSIAVASRIVDLTPHLYSEPPDTTEIENIGASAPNTQGAKAPADSTKPVRKPVVAAGPESDS